MRKGISRFDAISTQPVEESECHYNAVHTRLIRRLFREHEHVVSYHTNLVLRQYDPNGGWGQRPTTWRFVIMRQNEIEGAAIPASESEAINRDHLNFLRNMCGYTVEERVLLDRRNGQTAFEKYMLELDRPPHLPDPEIDAKLGGLLDALLAEAGSAFGMRLILCNRVLQETESLPGNEPGQRVPGRLLPEVDRSAFVELYFDHQEWGDALFARASVRDLLLDPFFGPPRGYHLDERCGFDKR